MRVSAIIPVKSFAIAKSRLGLPPDKTAALCKMMLDELLDTVCASPAIDDTVVVTRDAEAAGAARERGAYVVEDQGEGVNRAVAIADAHLASDPPDSSVIFPQDIPFMKTQDVDFMMRHAGPPPCAIVVPSRRFDGTNALYRSPSCLMETHYDEDSYKIHLSTARKAGSASLVFVRRIMMDIDCMDDIRYCLGLNEKPGICGKIRDLLEDGGQTV